MKSQFLSKIACGCLLIASMAFNSCSEVLNIAPDGTITLDEVFQDYEKTGAYLNSCYQYRMGEGCRWFFWMRGPVEWCDESWDTDAEAESWITSGQLYSGNVTADNYITEQWFGNSDNENGDYWVRYWAGVRKCTVFLNNIEKANVPNAATKSRWTAEAHLLRAYYYAELLRWYGTGLPIEREVFPLDYDFTSTVKESYYDVVKFVLEDCDAALSSNDLPWRITTEAEAWRFTKAAAEAIKARMIVYAASSLYNEGSNYWEEAYQVSKSALSNLRAQGYQLYNTINYPQYWDSEDAFLPIRESAIFNEYFCNTMQHNASPVDKETIYQTKADQGQPYHINGVGSQCQYKTGTCPSQELIDCFETIDGQPILNLARPYLDEETHLQPNFNPANTLYKEQDPYANRDPRFYASFYYNGSKRRANWEFDESELSVENYPASAGYRTRIIATWDGEPQTGIHATVRKATRTGYYQRKFLHPISGREINPINGARHKSMRLGEVILNFAEAAAEANHLSEAKAAIDEIRARAGMPALPDGLSQADLILRVRNERRVELALEGFRYFDVRRWSNPNSDLKKTDQWITGIWITRNDDGSYTYNRGPAGPGNQRMCFSSKFLRAPIPMNEANLMTLLTGVKWQNPGW